MTALPRVKHPDRWRARRDTAKQAGKNSAYAQRKLELAVANEIRRELRDERKQGRAK